MSRKPDLSQPVRCAYAQGYWATPRIAPNTVRIYVDGACSGTGKPAGIGVSCDGLRYREYLGAGKTGTMGGTTSNIAELTAVLRGLELAAHADRPNVIYTDSRYAIGVLAKGWTAHKNTELVAYIKTKMRAFPQLTLAWVKGHAGVPGNEAADKLAKLAITLRGPRKRLNGAYVPQPAELRASRPARPCWVPIRQRFSELPPPPKPDFDYAPPKAFLSRP